MPRSKRPRETSEQSNARIYPQAASIVDRRIGSGENIIITEDANKLIAVWRDPAHLFETRAHAMHRLTDMLPARKSREGRIKIDDIDQLYLLDDETKSILSRSYSIVLPDGSDAQRVLFDMTHVQRMAVRETIKDQKKALTDRDRDVVMADRLFRKLGCPPAIAPSEFFPRRVLPSTDAVSELEHVA